VDVNNLIYSSIDGILYNKLQDTLIRCPMGKTDTTVIIPNSVTTIGENAFMNCINLISINIPDSVVTISRFAFFYCENLASVIIPSSVSTIKYGAFYACGSLASITIPNSVTMIEEAAFYACGSLASITIPNSVTTIGEAAFYDCHSLSSITIPNSLTTIEAWTFSSCQNLTSVIIPKSVTKIKSYAFTCIRLDTIICKAKYPPSLDQDVFWGVPQTALVYIPCGTTWYYEMNWVFTNYIEMGITPATPTNINIAEVGSGFVLTWQGETDSYNLYRDYQFLAAVSTNTYTDTDLISGVNYCYRVQSVVSEDCESELSEEVCKKSGVGILEAQSIASLQTIFPNPARSQFTVTHTENASLQLYNMVGQEVLHTQSTNENTIINVSTLPQGLYMLKVVKDGTVKMYKVVVSG